MRATIDGAGRVVIPKPLRDEIGLRPGQELSIEARDGQIVIEPVEVPMILAEERGVLVAERLEESSPLTREQVRELLERVRR